jgi:1-hydroxycarotenoid 3,4-desaturase
MPMWPRSADEIGRLAGAAEAARHLAFCKRARLIYQTLEQPFIYGSRPNALSLAARVGWRGLTGLGRISLFGSMWSALGRYFHDPRLRQLFGRYATYCGSSPFMAPATLMLVAHVEQDGVWLLEGGMHRLATTLADMAAKRGARLRYGACVQEVLVRDGKACGVRLADGETINAAAVVFNGDPAALATGLLGQQSMRAVAASSSAIRSLSAVTWNIVAPARGFALARHNVFFCDDYAAEFNDIYANGRLPRDPTVYVCAQDRGDSGGAEPRGPERLLCLVNAPANGDERGDQNRNGHSSPARDQAALARCEDAAFTRLAASGLRLYCDSDSTVRTTPHDFNQLFPATGGALYGQASHSWMASFRRRSARSRLDNLYLAGGGTHPGPGVPMAALSGRQAAVSVLADLGASAVRRQV